MGTPGRNLGSPEETESPAIKDERLPDGQTRHSKRWNGLLKGLKPAGYRMISVEAEGSDPLKKSKEPTRKDGVWGTESDPKKRLKTTHPAKTRTTEGPQTSGLCYRTRGRLLRCFA